MLATGWMLAGVEMGLQAELLFDLQEADQFVIAVILLVFRLNLESPPVRPARLLHYWEAVH